ncbi:MAG: serine/threonine protein kinase [Deltaproteobacteria bacterium]|nr:MAG: serine/threonine protein kinase [Deltaproteobacteria bacterium]
MIGTQLGSYRIVAALGKGGMGTVWEAEHELLGRRVAIKILDRRHSGNETVKARFVNEARAVSRLKHPSIVEVYDFGHAPDGRAYLVMERLTGEGLGHRLKRGPLPLDSALEFARQIASALHVAHEHGVVHRDLKPDNVFIEPDPEVDIGERAKVLDFGLAKQVDGSTDEDLTQTGVLLGTPAYMSPEQAGGRPITRQSDIYSFGVMLYRMITGALPFDVTDEREILGAHMFAEPIPPSRRAPNVPAALEHIVMRCLAKRPIDRFDDLRDVASRLGALAALRRAAPLADFTPEVTDVLPARGDTLLPLPPPNETGPIPAMDEGEAQPATAVATARDEAELADAGAQPDADRQGATAPSAAAGSEAAAAPHGGRRRATRPDRRIAAGAVAAAVAAWRGWAAMGAGDGTAPASGAAGDRPQPAPAAPGDISRAAAADAMGAAPSTAAGRAAARERTADRERAAARERTDPKATGQSRPDATVAAGADATPASRERALPRAQRDRGAPRSRARGGGDRTDTDGRRKPRASRSMNGHQSPRRPRADSAAPRATPKASPDDRADFEKPVF